MLTARKVRVHVRNKNRYNVETRNCKFLYVEVNDFAGTTIGDIKEDVRRQSRGAIRVDELFLDNQSLADDRSVAHYNLEDGCILETTSNPFWVACLYIKASEVKQEMEGNPNDKHIQEWTQKSLTKKYTLIGLLLNSKNEYGRQPPHFYTLDEFLIYLERKDKKGATMHPDYTQKDMRAFEREYRQEFLGRYLDPIASFIDHHAVRLGHALPDEIENLPLNGPNRVPRKFQNVGLPNMPVAGKPRSGGRKKQERYCDDCEEALAEVYCAECQGGLAVCRRCSAVLHAGASRRRHNLQDIEQAPSNSSKPYIPRAFLAPFAIVLAMYNALTTQSVLSLTEDEIKRRAQPLTDTDLQDKQAGKYVGGFDCMENVLMNKGYVKKEAARVPTYALSASGQMLGQRLYTFYTQFYRFMESCRLPKVHNTVRSGILNSRKICLIVDENERDKQRLLRYAAEKNIDAQVRLLPAGDYIWILTPPMVDQHNSYTGKDYRNEMVLPFVVERKSWEDFENSTNSGRFRRQINNMLGCGLANCFYLMEGGTSGLRNNPTQHHQQYLKGLLEKLVTENGFYVNYTSSWMKSAQWLLWFTGFLVDGWRLGLFQDSCISYQEYMSRVARPRGSTGTSSAFTNARKHTHIWKAQLFVDHIIRDSHGERSMRTTVEEDLGGTNNTNKHLLVIQDLEQYNKKRQSALNKCCEAVYTDPGQARDIVEDKLGPVIHNMLHYDIASYWQLYMQVLTGVYVVRTETDQDTEKMHRIFTSTFSATSLPLLSAAVPKASAKRPSKSPKTATVTSRDSNHASDGPVDLDHDLVRIGNNPVDLLFRNSDSDKYTDNDRIDIHNPAGAHSVHQHHNNTATPFHPLSEGIEGTNSVAGHVIKKGRLMPQNNSNIQTRQADMNMVKPFSGQGYCVGTRLEGNNSRYEQTARSANSMKHKVVVDSADKRHDKEGLVGGMWNSRVNIDDGRSGKTRLDNGEDERKAWNNQSQAVQNDDFVNSQNEEEIMKEILEKSAVEAREMSNEDEMMKLAVEISKQKSSKKTNTEASNLSHDEELSLALKMSKSSKQGGTVNNCFSESEDLSDVGAKGKKKFVDESSIVHMTEEEQVNHVLEMSKIEAERSKNRRGLDENSNEDELSKLTVEVSMKERKSLCVGAEKKYLPSVDENGIILIPDTEEAQMKLALEISKKDTPMKSENSSNRNGSEKFENRGKTCKRKFTDSEYPIGKLAVQDLEELSEEEQLRMAMELSMSQVTDDNSRLSQTKGNRSSENEDRHLNCPIKLTFPEEYKTGVSPCKISKHDLNYNKVNRRVSEKVENLFEIPAETNKRVEKNYNEASNVENEDLKIAIERSKVEHSPVKRVKLGKQILEEEEVMKIVIERSKVEHSPYKMNVREESNSKVESIDASNIEVIENNSQNSQETDKNDAHEEDKFSSLSECRITASAHTCLQRDNYLSHGCSIYCNKKELEKFGDSDDYIPPSPGRPGSIENITFSPKLFSNTPENTSNKPTLNKNPNNSPCGSTGETLTKTLFSQTSLIKRDITFQMSSGKYESEFCDGSSEKMKASVGNDTKFDIKASLFYDSDDSDCESEADIFDCNNEIETEVGKCDDKVRNVDGANDDHADNKESATCDIATKAVQKTEFTVELEQKNIDKAILNKSKVEEEKESTVDISNGSSGRTELMSESDEVKINNLKGLHQLPQTNLQHEVKDVSQASEPELQSLDDYIDYDDDNDIDYQPDSQDFKVESNFEDSSCSDIEEHSQERNDLDLLPLIRRPRKIRYRQVKEEEKKLYELKRKEKDLEKQRSETGIKTERINDTVTRGSEMTADELYARQLQEKLDREAKEEEGKLLIDDEYIARQLHEKLNKEALPKEKESEKDVQLTSVDIAVSTFNKMDSYKSNNNYSAAIYSSPEMFITESSAKTDLSKKQVEGMSNPEHVVRELQRRELEKIERWRKMLIEDEKLAQRLHEMADSREEEEAPAASSESLRKNALSQPVETSFKKMVTQHKASKEKAMAQLQQYRNLQMNRFKEMQNRTQARNDTGYLNQSQHNDVIVLDDSQNQIAETGILSTSNTNPRPSVTAAANICVSEDRLSNPSSICTVNVMNKQLYLTSTSERNQSQFQIGSHMSHLNQSQSLDGDNLIQSKQSNSVVSKHSNVTCGNCGEKGHNRTFIRCPKYHTAEESARREAKLEKQRHQKEEKRKQEVETIHMLSEHKKMLEDMTSQIQKEMGTIQDRLQQRSAELEAQVNLRVRKLENTDKKKKK